jgi:hypothetical protein
MSGSVLNRWSRAFGIDWAHWYTALKGLRKYWSDYRQMKMLNSIASDPWEMKPIYPFLTDFYGAGGEISHHYFHQDLLVAQKIFKRQPKRHVDCGSRIDGFVAHVATFRELEVLDYRDLSHQITNVKFRRCDLLQLPPDLYGLFDSVSCLHVLEHVGLGRYGDPIDFYGHVKSLENLAKMLLPGGILYLSVPFGFERIEFNAHRIFNLVTIRKLVEPLFEIVDFSVVDEAGNLDVAADLDKLTRDSNQYRYALAIFDLLKRT